MHVCSAYPGVELCGVDYKLTYQTSSFPPLPLHIYLQHLFPP